MRSFLSFLFVGLTLWLSAATYTPAEVPNVHKADRTQFVSNPDGILSPQAVAQLNSMMAAMRRQLTVEPMVVAIDNIENPDDYQQFATELFQLWGLGKDDLDNGLLLLMVKDRREVVIRTGYGLEGALPDIVCGRIIREVFAPEAAAGNYDGAVVATMALIDNILSDPETAEEYRSKAADADETDLTADEAFRIYLGFCCLMAVVMLIVFLAKLPGLKGKTDHEKYHALVPLRSTYLALTALGLFIPLIATLPLIIVLNRWRNRVRTCPNCSSRMQKLDEQTDNDYLTPSQDLEERIGSVDYDVWLCPNCGETDILPYKISSSTYTECDNCHARTMRPTGYRVVTRPTASRHGLAIKEYECLNCRHRRQDRIDLPPDNSANVAAAAAILGAMGGRGGGGGGPIGGGFGGGSTGGGGAGGRW